jgi:hypothetical protein
MPSSMPVPGGTTGHHRPCRPPGPASGRPAHRLPPPARRPAPERGTSCQTGWPGGGIAPRTRPERWSIERCILEPNSGSSFIAVELAAPRPDHAGSARRESATKSSDPAPDQPAASRPTGPAAGRPEARLTGPVRQRLLEAAAVSAAGPGPRRTAARPAWHRCRGAGARTPTRPATRSSPAAGCAPPPSTSPPAGENCPSSRRIPHLPRLSPAAHRITNRRLRTAFEAHGEAGGLRGSRSRGPAAGRPARSRRCGRRR